MLQFIRLYGLQGCSHCQAAGNYLQLHRVPFQYIVSDGDPVVKEGLAKIMGRAEFPALLVPSGKEVIIYKGFDEGNYSNVVRDYHAGIGAEPAYKVVEGRNDTGEAEAVGESEVDHDGRASEVPALSRLLDNDTASVVAAIS